MIRFTRCISLAVVCLLPHARPLAASPFNSEDGFPASAMNSSGDHVIAGDLKSYVSWEGRIFALKPHPGVTANARMSAGIAARPESIGKRAEPFVNRDDIAIICGGPEARVLNAGGVWRRIGAGSSLPADQPGRFFCAMSPQGRWLAYDQSARTLHMPGSTLGLDLGPFPQVIALAQGFLLAGRERAYFLSPGGKLREVTPHPFKGLHEHSTATANAGLILSHTAQGFFLQPYSQPGGEDFSLRGPALRLPVNPCGDEQRCGVSLGSDDSWLVSGYWGHFIGRGDVSFRVKEIPNMSLEVGGVAISHQRDGGRFLYLGNDDADSGKLDEHALPARPTSHSLAHPPTGTLKDGKPTFHAVWRRTAHVAGRSLPRNAIIVDSLRDGGFLELTFEAGNLPDEWPADTVAMERAESISLDRIKMEPHASLPADLWWRRVQGLEEALRLIQDTGLRSAPVTVGVVDSGLLAEHPFLNSHLAHNVLETPDNGLDDDGNGFVDDAIGYDFSDEDGTPQDEYGHGTHVTALIAGAAEGERLSVGLNAKVFMARIFDHHGNSNSIDIARAVIYATDRGAEVMNHSWAGGRRTQALSDAFSYAAGRGVMLMVAAGNDKTNINDYPPIPSSFQGAIPIGAYNQKLKKPGYSNFGNRIVQWFLPGDAMISATADGAFGAMDGTSMAAGFASGMAAYALGVFKTYLPDLSRKERNERVGALICRSREKSQLDNHSRCGAVNFSRLVQQLASLQDLL